VRKEPTWEVTAICAARPIFRINSCLHGPPDLVGTMENGIYNKIKTPASRSGITSELGCSWLTVLQ
jgi:hypothetical protein